MTTVKLSHPIARGPAYVAALQFRRPNFGDLETIRLLSEAENFDNVCQIISRLSQIPVETIEQIDAADLEPVMHALHSHLAGVASHVAEAPPRAATLH